MSFLVKWIVISWHKHYIVLNILLNNIPVNNVQQPLRGETLRVLQGDLVLGVDQLCRTKIPDVFQGSPLSQLPIWYLPLPNVSGNKFTKFYLPQEADSPWILFILVTQIKFCSKLANFFLGYGTKWKISRLSWACDRCERKYIWSLTYKKLKG